MSANTFELKPCIGTVIGTERSKNPQKIEWDQDEIWCNGTRIGYVSHHPDAVCRINRHLTEPTKRDVVAAIQRLRQEKGMPPVAEVASSLADPRAIRQSLQAAGRLPDDTEEEDDDE